MASEPEPINQKNAGRAPMNVANKPNMNAAELSGALLYMNLDVWCDPPNGISVAAA